jgi:multicomponent Na+:H+ antiporter subunit C
MPASIAALIGLLLAVALYLLLRRSTVDIIFGLILLGHASNLTVFAGGGLRRGEPPLLTDGVATHPVADPLPQALVLTAIVIGFAVVAFAIALVARLYAVAGTDDSDQLREQDE